MKTTVRRSLVAGVASVAAGLFIAGLFMTLTACVANDGYGGGVVYGGDYYEPDGYVYGHWHPGYHVAPPRRDRDAHPQVSRPQENRVSTPAYRPAPSSRSAPSIPSRQRGH
jgi:hypothetical protein